MKRLLLIWLASLTIFFVIASCDSSLTRQITSIGENIGNSNSISREEFTAIVEQFIEEAFPLTAFENITNSENIFLPGEETGGFYAVALPTGSQSSSNPFSGSKKYRKYEIFPEKLEQIDTHLFPINQYHARFPKLVTKLVQNGKTGQICKAIRDHWQEENNYDLWSNILGKLKIEFQPPNVPGLGFSTDINLDALDDMVAAFLIAHLVPGEVEVFVRGGADSCSGNRPDCPIAPLGGKPYDYSKVSMHRFREPLRDNPELMGWEDGTTEIQSVDPYGYYWNSHLPHLRAQFFVDEILQPLVGRCTYPRKNESVGILENRSTLGIDPLERRAEIYLLINKNW